MLQQPLALLAGAGVRAAATMTARLGHVMAVQHPSEVCPKVLCALSVQVVEEEEDEQVLSWVGCFVWLASVTVLISILSDYIMDAITGQFEGEKKFLSRKEELFPSCQGEKFSPYPHTIILLQLSNQHLWAQQYKLV